MAMSLPRTFRMSSSGSLSRFLPSKLTCPWTILPGGLGIRRINDSALTLLPQPDSPTRPKASPSLSVNETPFTALTTPSCVKNWVRRSFTSKSARFVSRTTGGVYRSLSTPAQDGFAGRCDLVEPSDDLVVGRGEHHLRRLVGL